MTSQLKALADDELNSFFDANRAVTYNGDEVSFRHQGEAPNDALYNIRRILFLASKRYCDYLTDCGESVASPAQMRESRSLDWLGELPAQITPEEAALLHLYGELGEKLQLDKPVVDALRRVFPDNSMLCAGDVRFSQEAFDLLRKATGMGPEISLDPAEWPEYELIQEADLPTP